MTIETPFPNGNLASLEDRWRLIEENTLPAYLDLDPDAARDLAAADVGERIDEQRLGVDDVIDVVTDWKIRTRSIASEKTDASPRRLHDRDHSHPQLDTPRPGGPGPPTNSGHDSDRMRERDSRSTGASSNPCGHRGSRLVEWTIDPDLSRDDVGMVDGERSAIYDSLDADHPYRARLTLPDGTVIDQTVKYVAAWAESDDGPPCSITLNHDLMAAADAESVLDGYRTALGLDADRVAGYRATTTMRWWRPGRAAPSPGRRSSPPRLATWKPRSRSAPIEPPATCWSPSTFVGADRPSLRWWSGTGPR